MYKRQVLDDDPNSAAGLAVVENTLIDADNSGSSDGSSGGALIWLLGAFLLAVPRLKKKK